MIIIFHLILFITLTLTTRMAPSPQVAIKKVLIFEPAQKKRLGTEAAIMKATGLGQSRKASSQSDALLASGFGPSTYLQTDGNL